MHDFSKLPKYVARLSSINQTVRHCISHSNANTGSCGFINDTCSQLLPQDISDSWDGDGCFHYYLFLVFVLNVFFFLNFPISTCAHLHLSPEIHVAQLHATNTHL